MKISTNSTLAKNKPGWIDFNAGVIVENEPMEKTCERFIDYFPFRIGAYPGNLFL